MEASCPGLLAQKTVTLFVTPSTHSRIFVLALRNQEVVPSWHLPTSMKSFSQTTDLNLWRIPIVLVYALVNAADYDASKWLPTYGTTRLRRRRWKCQPHGVGPTYLTAPPRVQDIPPDSLPSRVAKLDPADRNLVGTATAAGK